MAQGREPGFQIRLLGRFEVWQEGKLLPPQAWPQRKTETLLKILLTDKGQVFSQDQLIEYLFPELELNKAADNLYRRISELRHMLEPDLKRGAQSQYILRAGLRGYRFNETAPCWIDLEEFQRLCTAGRELAKANRWPGAVEHFIQAVALYRGSYLAEDVYEEWALAARERWRELYLQALAHLAECHARLRQYPRAIDLCRQLIALEPYRESAYRAQMAYHYYNGEPAEALKVYEACVRALKEGLNADPAAETKEFRQLILQGKVPNLPQAVPNNLPAPATRFIGREAELSQLAKLLEDPDCRLITLLGPGGIGKTRLALEAAGRGVEKFPQGVFFIPLAPESSTDSLIFAMADALEFPFHGNHPPKQQLLDYLREKSALLVLDNMEHLAKQVELLPELLKSAARLKLLVTSRERLNFQNEWLLQLDGLSLPTGSPGEKELESYGATRLFIERAKQVTPRFSVSAADKPHVISICQLVEGMPLGIELAASWSRTLTCEEISNEISRNLDFLTTLHKDVPSKHQSMRAVFDHSWQLLGEEERLALQKLSALRGGFSREACEKAASVPSKHLLSLLDKSLLQRKEDGLFSMHEMIRRFAAEKLESTDLLLRQTSESHARYFLELLQEKGSALQGKQQKKALQDVARELENVIEAWHWAVQHEKTAELLNGLDGLFLFYDMRSRFQEGIKLFATLVEALEREQPALNAEATLLLGKALARMGRFYERMHLNDRAQELLSRSLRMAQSAQIADEQAFCLNSLGNLCEKRGEYPQAKHLYLECLDIHTRSNHRLGMAKALNNMGVVSYRTGEFHASRDFLLRCRQLCQQMDEQFILSRAVNNLGIVAYYLHEYQEAQRLFQEAAQLDKEMEDHWGAAACLTNLGAIAEALKDAQGAAQQFKECLTLRRSLGDQWGIAATLNNLASVSTSLGLYDDAKQYLHEALERVVELKAVPLTLEVVVNWATLLSHQGKKEQAVEILHVCLEHPALNQAIRETAEPLLSELKGSVPSGAFQAAERKSKAKTLEEVTSDLLKEIEA